MLSPIRTGLTLGVVDLVQGESVPDFVDPSFSSRTKGLDGAGHPRQPQQGARGTVWRGKELDKLQQQRSVLAD